MANTELFKKIRDQIKRDPKTFDMEAWATDLSLEVDEMGEYLHTYYDPNTGREEEINASECGTIRCVAGWAIHFEAERLGMDVNRHLRDVMKDLAKALDIDWGYEAVAEHILGIDGYGLFYKESDEAYRIVDDYAEGRRG